MQPLRISLPIQRTADRTGRSVPAAGSASSASPAPPPSPVAAEARALGIVIYCIGLTGADGIDISVLNDWATDPDTSHVAVTPDDADLEQLFADLAKNISKPGATNIVIDEVIHPDFAITNLVPPSKGTAMMVNANTLQWKIPELGMSGGCPRGLCSTSFELLRLLHFSFPYLFSVTL